MANKYPRYTAPVFSHAPANANPNLPQLIAQAQAEHGLATQGPSPVNTPQSNEAWTGLIQVMGYNLPHDLRRARTAALAMRRAVH